MTNKLIPMLLAASFAMPAIAMAQATPNAAAPAPSAAATAPASRGTHGVLSSSDRVEQRIADMHTKLHITAAQQPQWDAFAAVMRENATNMHQVFESRSGKFKTMNAVDNMQSYEAIAQQHAASLQKLVPAFATLYASLSDQQKKEADEMFRAAPSARMESRHS